jgi:dCMP deaminase
MHLMNNPMWDIRFLRLAKHIASWSKDPSTKVGAVIVDDDQQIVSTGYNGFPFCFPDDEEAYANRDLKLQRIIHAEMNAVMNAKRSVRGCTLYTWPFMTCDVCAKHMLQAGITRFVAPTTPVEIEERWRESISKALGHIKRASRPIVFLDNEVIDGRNWFDPEGS